MDECNGWNHRLHNFEISHKHFPFLEKETLIKSRSKILKDNKIVPTEKSSINAKELLK